MEDSLDLLRLLLLRLEKISADSVWAHRASGVRGSLLRALEKIESGESASRLETARLMDMGFYILQKAAEEKIK
ncbi:MAG: hypothetical protein PHQ36_03345 [Anaerolineales bacterium]|nr:hypothetical protein [Anaerolineales bacterium]